GTGWRIRLLDTTTGKERLDGDYFGNDISSLAYSPTGEHFALVSGKTIQVYDTATRRQVHALEGPEVGISGIAFTADGTNLISASSDGQIYRWNTRSGQPLPRIRSGGRGQGHAVAVSHDGALVAIGSGYLLTLWNTHQTKELRRLAVPTHWNIPWTTDSL